MVRRIVSLAALTLLLIPAFSLAQFKQGDWELTLGGQGSTPSDFGAFSFGANGSIGLFVADQLEVGLRQAGTYTDLGPGAAWTGSTAIFTDFHFDFGAFQPFIGANIGYAYGENVTDTFFAGPEGGLKYFVNGTTFVFGLVQYQFFFESGDDIGNQFEDGQFVYTLGIGFRF